MNEDYTIKSANAKDSALIKDLMEKNWGCEPLVVHGKNYYPSSMDGLLLFHKKNPLGFLFYEKHKVHFEIIVFEVFEKHQGLGTLLLKAFVDQAKAEGCEKIVVMTTNDLLDALRFYQRRGFTISGVFVNALEEARKMKPSIPEIGEYDIPLRDEIMLEYDVKNNSN